MIKYNRYNLRANSCHIFIILPIVHNIGEIVGIEFVVVYASRLNASPLAVRSAHSDRIANHYWLVVMFADTFVCNNTSHYSAVIALKVEQVLKININAERLSFWRWKRTSNDRFARREWIHPVRGKLLDSRTVYNRESRKAILYHSLLSPHLTSSLPSNWNPWSQEYLLARSWWIF